jgi:hypothetical protein
VGPESSEVHAGFGQAQRAIGAAANLVSVVIILTIVLPEADRAESEPTAIWQGQESAAGARIWTLARRE